MFDIQICLSGTRSTDVVPTRFCGGVCLSNAYPANYDGDYEQMVAAMLDGDHSATAHFRNGLRLLIGRRLNWSDETDDTVEDVLVTVVCGGQQRRSAGYRALPGYVRTVALHCVAATIRNAKRCKHMPLEAVAGRMRDYRDQDEATLRERRELVHKTLLRLDPRDREVLRRYYVEEQSPEQVCSDMQLSYNQFMVIKTRAKSEFGKLGQTLAGHARNSIPAVA